MSSFENDVRPITDREYRLLRDMIYAQAGIYLAETKKALLVGRLRKRIRALHLSCFSAYYELVRNDRTGQELVQLLDAITTNETAFFREPRQFDYLRTSILPAWATAADQGLRQRKVRIWSAACSSGEEPYSIAMSLLDFFGTESGWTLEILATDISTRVLDQAQAGIWPISRAENIPDRLLKRYMLRGTGSQQGKMKAGREVRSILRFDRINLNDESYDVNGGFDAIFCRNVLIYFNRESRERVINRLLNLAGGGYLFLGHAESLAGMACHARCVAPAVYQTGFENCR